MPVSSVAGVEDDGRPAQSKEESSGMGTSLLSELRRELDAAVQTKITNRPPSCATVSTSWKRLTPGGP